MTPLKLLSVSFASLSPSLIENLELQLLAELSSFRGLYSGTAPAPMILMFWGVCVAVGNHTGVNPVLSNHILAYVLEYVTQIRIFNICWHLK